MSRTILEVQDLRKHYPVRGGLLNRVAGVIRAVDGVSIAVEEGTTYGIAGESGSGKSTLCMCIARLLEPTSGKLIFEGEDYTKARRGPLKKMRSKIQIVFQNPISSLDPQMSVKRTVLEPAKAQGLIEGDGEQKAKDLLAMVGLPPSALSKYPHELSGGMSQRVAIARSLSVSPSLLILDEPTSALDASVQAQVLNLFNKLQSELGITYVLVSHDLSVIGHMCDRVAVMYAGKVVEAGSFEDVFFSTQHPYTGALLGSAHYLRNAAVESRFLLGGDMPSPRNPPPGCTLNPRCPFATDLCRKSYPPLEEQGGHRVACYHREEVVAALGGSA
ncbi:MAG: ABC transporter ATP-binding protein [Thaumarchaeota archaeon]|nr:ABC transporter ATP-binding protein [Nitrososphaerota archaeon]